MITLYVGYDDRESVAYHTFCESVIKNSSKEISFVPLSLKAMSYYTESHKDGSNDFIYTRFLVPYLNKYLGWAIFSDGDMICKGDIAKLMELADDSKAVMVVKHDYKTKHQIKYLGNKNENYPRKNWSSLILWNCSHKSNKVLTPDLISQSPGSFLHRFSWLQDDEIGDLPKEWNWLAIEYPQNSDAELIHYTLGTPCFSDYRHCEMSEEWHKYYQLLNTGME